MDTKNEGPLETVVHGYCRYLESILNFGVVNAPVLFYYGVFNLMC